MLGRAVSLRPRHGEAEHHPALHVLGDVAVRHPQAGVADVVQDVHGLACADEHRVLPHQVRLDSPVAGQDQEPPCTVEVEGVMHGMVGLHFVDQPDLDPLSDAEPPVDCRAVDPSGASRNLQRMVALVLDRLTSTMSSSHSIPSAVLCPSVIAMVGVMVGHWLAGRLGGE